MNEIERLKFYRSRILFLESQFALSFKIFFPYELCRAPQELIFVNSSWFCTLSFTSKLFSLKWGEAEFLFLGCSYEDTSKGGISSNGFFRVPDGLVANVTAETLR